ncbi:MAG: beta-propeller fold lactonase family protein [Burkholderiales bacterium]|nr:beta-propeller fold lactonase family protein [Burkholderiales bacterium]
MALLGFLPGHASTQGLFSLEDYVASSKILYIFTNGSSSASSDFGRWVIFAGNSPPPLTSQRKYRKDSGREDGALISVPMSSTQRCGATLAGVLTPGARFLYVANGTICAYAFDLTTGVATSVPGTPFRAGKYLSSLVRDRSSNYLYAADQNGHSIYGFSINPVSGVLTPVPGSPVSTGNSPLAIAVDGSGRYVYTADNGGLSVSGYAIDPANGALTPVPGSPFPAPVRPWAIAADPLGKYVYLVSDLKGVQPYRIAPGTGTLTPVGGPIDVGGGRGVTVDPTGRFVYVTSGSGPVKSGVNAFAIGPDGRLTAIGARVPTGDSPLAVVTDPGGRFVYTANLFSNNVSAFRIDPAGGGLTPIAGSPFPGNGTNAFGLATSGAMATTEYALVGKHFSEPIGTDGGRPPYTWSLASGALPPGIALDATTGMVAGTPTTAGSFVFTARVFDSVGVSAMKAFTLNVGASSAPTPVTVVEYYNAALDHYFITWMPTEIAILDAGTQIKGWVRTGQSFKAFTGVQSGTSPVCRYYIPPGLGDSHFFGRGSAECAATGQKNPSFVLESSDFMQLFLPAAGVCPVNTINVYRVFSNRPDANHRYLIDKALRDQMSALGWLIEGDGPEAVVMCAPA